MTLLRVQAWVFTVWLTGFVCLCMALVVENYAMKVDFFDIKAKTIYSLQHRRGAQDPDRIIATTELVNGLLQAASDFDTVQIRTEQQFIKMLKDELGTAVDEKTIAYVVESSHQEKVLDLVSDYAIAYVPMLIYMMMGVVAGEARNYGGYSVRGALAGLLIGVSVIAQIFFIGYLICTLASGDLRSSSGVKLFLVFASGLTAFLQQALFATAADLPARSEGS
jgi:hypothetical protein